MSDLISRQAALDSVNDCGICIQKILDIPSAEPEERTAKVVEHDASVTATDGYKYHRSEYLCGACKKKVLGGDDYCSHCGAKLIWNDEDIPMEYFENGGI